MKKVLKLVRNTINTFLWNFLLDNFEMLLYN